MQTHVRRHAAELRDNYISSRWNVVVGLWINSPDTLRWKTQTHIIWLPLASELSFFMCAQLCKIYLQGFLSPLTPNILMSIPLSNTVRFWWYINFTQFLCTNWKKKPRTCVNSLCFTKAPVLCRLADVTAWCWCCCCCCCWCSSHSKASNESCLLDTLKLFVVASRNSCKVLSNISYSFRPRNSTKKKSFAAITAYVAFSAWNNGWSRTMPLANKLRPNGKWQS